MRTYRRNWKYFGLSNWTVGGPTISYGMGVLQVWLGFRGWYFWVGLRK